ncbi:L,D-transpeptidase [Micromonospora yasonensis]|uniref:L,D-transpeptidase n=1 Tax=Micromonospora yasonensis TaxID=1128667 RepID=UPI003873C595
MQVFQGGKLVKTFPVSLGKPLTPTSSGNMVIMSREARALWVYGPDGQLEVKHAERLTADGEYIHGAPWSVDDQGQDNVSNGCTNLSPDSAEWVYNNSRIGDPVTVTGINDATVRATRPLATSVAQPGGAGPAGHLVCSCAVAVR